MEVEGSTFESCKMNALTSQRFSLKEKKLFIYAK
jgi:hypothetical protein